MIKRYLLIFYVLLLALAPAVKAQEDQEDIVIGVQHLLVSEVLGQERPIYVGLPRDYDENKKYPVLYLLDGGRYFLMAHGTMDFQYNRAQRSAPMILVAIPNVYRNTDLTPVYESDDPNARTVPYSGGADKFLRFLKEELRPFIDQTYTTSGTNILFGHSLAGLFATYSFLKEPELFDHYIISDPSLWYGENMLITMLANNKDAYQSISKKIFMTQIDRTTDEEDIMSGPQAAFMAELEDIQSLNAVKLLIEGETHSSVPLKSLYEGLTFIFREVE